MPSSGAGKGTRVPAVDLRLREQLAGGTGWGSGEGSGMWSRQGPTLSKAPSGLRLELSRRGGICWRGGPAGMQVCRVPWNPWPECGCCACQSPRGGMRWAGRRKLAGRAEPGWVLLSLQLRPEQGLYLTGCWFRGATQDRHPTSPPESPRSRLASLPTFISSLGRQSGADLRGGTTQPRPRPPRAAPALIRTDAKELSLEHTAVAGQCQTRSHMLGLSSEGREALGVAGRVSGRVGEAVRVTEWVRL